MEQDCGVGRWFVMNRLSMLKKLLAINAASGAKPMTDTVTGNPATFTTDIKRNLKGLTIPFDYENGISGLKIYRTGANLFNAGNVERRDGYILDDSGAETSSVRSGYTLSKTPVCPNTEYTFDGDIVKSIERYWRLYFYDRSGAFISRTASYVVGDLPYTFTTPSGCYGIAYQYQISEVDFATFVVSVGDSATFAAYAGNDYSVSFGETANTGSFDAVTGELSITSPSAKTIQLDPVQIKTLTGMNVLWSDTGGENTVVYLTNT